uniref:Nitrite reductase n=1 Tax=Blastobotrys adeninivorans TaxID=409370 RepID=B3WFS5_BLAAD|nr:nitrite reductase [Blastobotrys adeninivorans]
MTITHNGLATPPKQIVLVGFGMVGMSFVEQLLERDLLTREYSVTILGEEKYLAYNRVGLADYFSHQSVNDLYLNDTAWYESIDPHHMVCRVNEPVTSIDTKTKKVLTNLGHEYSYDLLIMATGSRAVLPSDIISRSLGYEPSVEESRSHGIFVYRTVDDLQEMIRFSTDKFETKGKRAIVVGGGLLGLEAAKSLLDMEKFHNISIVHRSKWLLSQQLDQTGGEFLCKSVRELGVEVRLSTEIVSLKFTDGQLSGVKYKDGTEEECDLIFYAIGIRPRDELADAAGLKLGSRGGIDVNSSLETSVKDIYAIGECASWNDKTFGLIAPGVQMADVLTWNLTQAKMHKSKLSTEPDLSTRLKLMGVDVASFGDYFADINGPSKLPGRTKKTTPLGPDDVQALTYQDPFKNIYKKLIFTKDGKYLIGGILVGDVSSYTKFNSLVQSGKVLDKDPHTLVLGTQSGEDDVDDLDDSVQVCSCKNVTKGQLVAKIRDGSCTSVGELKSATKAATACGGCEGMVKSIFDKEMKAMGKEVSNALCIHFSQSRADLFNLIMVQRLDSFQLTMEKLSKMPDSAGCEICKPTIGSILASLYNKNVMDRQLNGLQDTNDRYLGNIQRNGTYSIVPRMSAGEVTPEKLVVLGEIGKKYNLYTKITGGQRIDLFGAHKQDLPEIWEQLNAAGFESGHAYGKSLRTVKSCVGSTWCRYGIGDSVGLAVRLEQRYKSLRAPHKFKGAVSGCVRDCAEFHNKDFGICAVQNGFNVYVGGNGGMKPAHAQLLAADVLPDRVIPLLDRYLMLYIRTGERLRRTARWLESLPGGIEYLKDVIVHDKLGICAELEEQMQALVDSYFDEWKVAQETPEIRKKFSQFANTRRKIETMDIVMERGQPRPADWPEDASAKEDFKGAKWSSLEWTSVCSSDDLPIAESGSSTTVLIGDTQIAIFRLKDKIYASQNMCGHKRAFVLSQGIISTDEKNNAYISCPLHKRNYVLEKESSEAGSCKNDPSLSIATFNAMEKDGKIWLQLPPVQELDALLGTNRWKVRKTESSCGSQFKELDAKYGQRMPVSCGELSNELSW